jgi:glycosyltransferase involved in cell wall biosynthesis
LQARLAELGVSEPLDIRFTPLLHHRWKRMKAIGYRPFVALNRRRLARANAVYTRWPDISAALARVGIRHSLEVHNSYELEKLGMVGAVVDAHRRGVIEWLVPISRAAAEFLVGAGADPKRIHVSPSGADLDDFATIPAFDPARLDHPRIVYAGRISHSRGLGMFETIAERGLAEVSLVGEKEREVRSVPSLQVFPAVPHRDIPQWYAQADLVLLPYQRDLGHAQSISPVKLFEAMAAGRPIIASDIAPIREVMEHMKTAILVDPEDTESWIAAVELLKRERTLAAQLAAAARALAPQYTWRERAQNLARTLGWPIPGTAPCATPVQVAC